MILISLFPIVAALVRRRVQQPVDMTPETRPDPEVKDMRNYSDIPTSVEISFSFKYTAGKVWESIKRFCGWRGF